MNNQYLDFWQNTILNVFDNKKHSENMNKIVAQSLSNIEDFTSTIEKMTNFKILSPSLKYFNMEEPTSFDFKKTYQDYLKILDLVSIKEYRTLEVKCEGLVKKNANLETAQEKQGSQSTELDKTISSQKNKLTSLEKTIGDQKKKLAEHKKLESDHKKILTKNNQQTDKLKKELKEAKSLSDTLKKENAEKDKTIKKLQVKKNK